LFKLKPGRYKTLEEDYRFAPKASGRPSIVKSSGEWRLAKERKSKFAEKRFNTESTGVGAQRSQRRRQVAHALTVGIAKRTVFDEWPFEAQGKRVASGEGGGKWTARTPQAHSQEWLCHWAQGRG